MAELLRIFKGHSDLVLSVAFSSDGKYILSGSDDKTLKLWDIETGREIRTFKGHLNYVRAVAFDPDGKYAISGSFDDTVRLWNVSTGREIRTFRGHSRWVTSVTFSPDGKFIISGSLDNTARLWDVESGLEIAQLIGFANGEWITITPEGYYNSSLKGHKSLNIRRGNKVYGINQFYDVFYRPDIVAHKLMGQDISELITVSIDEAIKNPPPIVEFISVPKNTASPKVKLKYRVKSTGGGIGEVRVFHNGKLIKSDGYYRSAKKTWLEKITLAQLNSRAIYNQLRSIAVIGKPFSILSKNKGQIFEGNIEIETVPNENTVSIAAFNAENTVQSALETATFQSTVKARDPHLYILTVGIDRYTDTQMNLKYAAKDAKDMATKLFVQAATLFKVWNIHHEIMLDQDVKKSKVMSKVNELAEKIKIGDSFILFFAGHGVLVRDQYYLITHDYNGKLGDYCMINSNEIVEMSKRIKALSQLFIFDTCYAGGVDYIISSLYDARMSVLAKKMGLHIYAAANSVQEALDGFNGNGLFSHVLLTALNNNKTADENEDKNVSVVELGKYSKIKTIELAKKIGHSQTPLIINFGKDNLVYRLRQ